MDCSVKKITIDGVEYVRADSVSAQVTGDRAIRPKGYQKKARAAHAEACR